MWVLSKLSASGVVSRRFISLLAVACVTATFAILGPLSGQALAESAEWNGKNLSYEGNAYTREQPNPLPVGDGRGRAGEVAYTWIETLSNGDKKAHTIFFENDSKLQAKDTAVLITYGYQQPNTYSSPSPPITVNITASLLGDEIDNETQSASTCSGGVFLGLGWILCPVSMWLSEAVDGFYAIVRDYLEVPLVSTDDQSGMYALWKVMRTIANVFFVIAFMIIIYSQLTSIGISNYNIKAMLPRLIIAALLVNMSYFICSIAIDAFNVIGHSIQSVLVSIRENISITNVEELTWSNLSNTVLAGGAGAVGIAGVGAYAGSAPALGFMFLVGIISVGFAIFVAFVILAARQALITLLVIIAPLAFVAYLLPNTEQYFQKWMKSLLSLLMFFPIFSLLFGGSQLAGLTIIQRGISANQLHIVLLGMVVQIVPLIITPLLIQFSTGLLGRIAGIANNANKGPLDGLKNNLRGRAEEAKMKSLAKDRGMLNPNIAARMAQRVYGSNQAMERRKKAYETKAQALALASNKGQDSFDLEKQAEIDSQTVNQQADKSWNTTLLQNAAIREKDITRRVTSDELDNIKKDVDNRYTEFKSGRNTYNDPPTESIARLQGRAQDTALGITTKALRQAQAEDELRSGVNAKILQSQELQNIASGIGDPQIMLAGLVAKDRDEYNKQVQAQNQLTRHFDLMSEDYQKLAVGKENIRKEDKHGNVHIFDANNAYVRDSAIVHQFSAGSYSQKMEIIDESGDNVEILDADGSVKSVRAGNNADYRATIQTEVIKSGFAEQAPFVNDKTFDYILKGEWKGESSAYAHSLREIMEGRLKGEGMKKAKAKALKYMFTLGDLKNSSDPKETEKFERIKADYIGMLGAGERDAARKDFESTFAVNYNGLLGEANQIMDTPLLRSSADEDAQKVYRRYAPGYKPPGAPTA